MSYILIVLMYVSSFLLVLEFKFFEAFLELLSSSLPLAFFGLFWVVFSDLFIFSALLKRKISLRFSVLHHFRFFLDQLLRPNAKWSFKLGLPADSSGTGSSILLLEELLIACMK